ncbi:MAG: 30S ribosomal protein S21 [Candidatus Rokuibacteriota bacterium]
MSRHVNAEVLPPCIDWHTGTLAPYFDEFTLDKALRQLKKSMAMNGAHREIKRQAHYVKPSEARRMKSELARAKARKLTKKIADSELRTDPEGLRGTGTAPVRPPAPRPVVAVAAPVTAPRLLTLPVSRNTTLGRAFKEAQRVAGR